MGNNNNIVDLVLTRMIYLHRYMSEEGGRGRVTHPPSNRHYISTPANNQRTGV